MELTGAEILIECLKEQKVDTIFGFPGGAVLNIYDALFKDDTIRHILTAHEQGASHAADGYARASGKIGVCLGTSGPGATNLVTGIATAYMDSIPMVAITGNVPANLLGKDSFQEVDIAGITMPVTKHNFIVMDINKLADTVREAFAIAGSGRPGPVLIDIPKNITIEKCEYSPKKAFRIKYPHPDVTEGDWSKAAKMIDAARSPFIYAGGGVIISKAAEELNDFAKKINAGVGVSLMAIGVMKDEEPLYTGMIGMHGTKSSNLAVSKCDLLIVLGARFSDRVVGKVETFAANAKILQIDLDPAEINKNVEASFSLVSDLKGALSTLTKKVQANDRKEWVDEIVAMKRDFPVQLAPESQRAMTLLNAATEITNGEAIVVTEVGQHQMWAAQFYGFTKPYSFLTSGGLGTMGYGTGAAMGAVAAAPERTVINVAGDGSFKMNFNELTTAVRNNLPIKVLLMNNHCLGMVRQWQTFFYDKRYAATTLDHDIDWMKLAEAMGAGGMQIAASEDPRAKLKEAFEMAGPVIIECEIPTDDKVFPMVPPGVSIADMLDGTE